MLSTSAESRKICKNEIKMFWSIGKVKHSNSTTAEIYLAYNNIKTQVLKTERLTES